MAVWNSPVLRRGLIAASTAFLLSRAVVYGAAFLAPWLLPEGIYADLPNVPFHTVAPHFVDALVRWDSIHYLSIASQGYQVGQGPWDTNTPFLPLYPWLMRLLGGWAGEAGLVYVGLILSNAAFFAALTVLYHLTEEDFGPEVARRSVLYLSVFPTAFFFSALYAEALFLLLVLSFFAALRREHWLLAGAWGGLAALTRVLGLLLLPVYFWVYLRRNGSSSRLAIQPLLAFGLIPGGTLTFLGLLWLEVGDPLSFLRVQGLWGRSLTNPTNQLTGILSAFTRDGLHMPGFELLFPLALVVLFAATGLRIFATQPLPYRVWFSLYLAVSLTIPSAAPLYSVIRFLLLAFPAFIVLGEWGEHVWLHWSYLVLSTAFLFLSTVLFSQWYWVA